MSRRLWPRQKFYFGTKLTFELAAASHMPGRRPCAHKNKSFKHFLRQSSSSARGLCDTPVFITLLRA